ncbi:MAG TPA: AAA family ATPase [Rubrobacter sp.]|nr:AAA family ATPase [Rubrobacter sp.]
MFRQSGLYRKKWDREDYRNRTIAEALSGKTEFYTASKTVRLVDGTEHKIEDLQSEEIGKLVSSIEPEEVSWLWPSWLTLGKMALVDGDPGLGKSAMTLDLAARISAGKRLPDGAHCEPAWSYSPPRTVSRTRYVRAWMQRVRTPQRYSLSQRFLMGLDTSSYARWLTMLSPGT